MTSSLPSLKKLDRLWVTETIRLREEYAGPLEDAEANRQARLVGGDLPTLIQQRALWLARRDGLLESLQHWRQSIRLAGFLLMALAVFTGAGLAFTALGDGHQPVNVFWALGSLLGFNLLTLSTWLLSLAITRKAKGSGGVLGRLWLWLGEKLARDDRAAILVQGLLALTRQQRLTRWLLGTGAHSLWLLVMTSALVTLLALLATRRYGFVWETTILNEGTFVALTQALGALPGLLDFQVPSLEQIQLSGVMYSDLEVSRQVWASWLTGVVFVYGLLPRLGLAIFCYGRWRYGRRQLQLDLQRPAYRLLAERLQPTSERLGVNDPAPATLPTPGAESRPISGAGAVIVAIELDDRQPWPPQLPEQVANAGVLDDRAQRKRLLEDLTQHPPARLVVACDPRRSPDRGTLSLISELSHCAALTRIWLLPAPPDEHLDDERLADWNEALNQLEIPYASTSPLHWLETGHD